MRIKPIENFPDYFISDTGIVFSKAKRANKPKPTKMNLLSTWICNTYPSVHIRKNKKGYKRFIHRLILEAFVGKCPAGLQCRHLDGNPVNNNLENLKWGTRSENQMDRVRHGRHNRGKRHGMSKLCAKDVLKIRKFATSYNKKTRKCDKGGNYKEIAEAFNVSKSTIVHIVRGSTWTWLK